MAKYPNQLNSGGESDSDDRHDKVASHRFLKLTKRVKESFQTNCERCGGTGKNIAKTKCETCKGHGKIFIDLL